MLLTDFVKALLHAVSLLLSMGMSFTESNFISHVVKAAVATGAILSDDGTGSGVAAPEAADVGGVLAVLILTTSSASLRPS